MKNFPRWQVDKEGGRNKKKQRKNPRLGTLAHELLNQLSVIQLACFSLRQQAVKGAAASSRDIDAIETAVLEAAERANAICAKLENSQSGEEERRPESLNLAPGAKTNVYPFPALSPGKNK